MPLTLGAAYGMAGYRALSKQSRTGVFAATEAMPF